VAEAARGGPLENTLEVASSPQEEEVNDGAESAAQAKPRVVRVKRKREQPPLENIWLEVSDPPSKRHEPDIGALTLSSTLDSAPPTNVTTPSKLLFWRVETVSPSNKTGVSIYESLLQKVSERKLALEKRKEPRESRPKSKGKQDQLLHAAKEKHEAVAKRARFEQVWKSRRVPGKTSSDDDEENDALCDHFHLYDVVRVDEEGEAEVAEKRSQRERAKREAALADGALMCNYLPLLRECLPEVAADVEEDLATLVAQTEKEDYVYDVYAMAEDSGEQEGLEDQFVPTVQIVEKDGDDWGEPAESEYDSQDSNDENNPINDYPDEDDFGDGVAADSSDDGEGSGDFDPFASDNEEYDTVAFDIEEQLRWSRRR